MRTVCPQCGHSWTGKAVARESDARLRSNSRLSTAIKDVSKKVDKQEIERVALEFLRIESPPGRESDAAEYLGGLFGALGLKVSYQEVAPNRKNVICTLKGQRRGPALMLSGHLDTGKLVDIQPYTKENWIFGPGAANMKIAFPAYYMAVKSIMESEIGLEGDLTVSGVVGETERSEIGEYKGNEYRGAGVGTIHMLNHGVTTDYCIIGEPTGLRVQNGNCGVAYARISTRGIIQAVFAKEYADDAIAKALKIKAAIDAWEPAYQKRHPHDFMKPRMSIGSIVGGHPFRPSGSAEFCNLYLHISTLPGQRFNDLKHELEDLLKDVKSKNAGVGAEIELYLTKNGYQVSTDSYIFQAVDWAHKQVFKKAPLYPTPERFSVTSDGVYFNEYGIPTITYGVAGITPRGNYANRDEKTGHECSNLDNVTMGSKVYAASAVQICGLVS